MAKPLLVGLGDRRRQDDALGRVAAEELGYLFLDSVHVVCCDRLTSDLVPYLQRAGLIIFLHACAGPRPGEVICGELAMTPVDDVHTGLSLEVLLDHAHLIVNPAFRVAGVGASFLSRDELTPSGEQALERMVAATTGLLVDRAFTGPGPFQSRHK